MKVFNRMYKGARENHVWEKPCTQQASCPGRNLPLPEPSQKGTNRNKTRDPQPPNHPEQQRRRNRTATGQEKGPASPKCYRRKARPSCWRCGRCPSKAQKPKWLYSAVATGNRQNGRSLCRRTARSFSRCKAALKAWYRWSTARPGASPLLAAMRCAMSVRQQGPILLHCRPCACHCCSSARPRACAAAARSQTWQLKQSDSKVGSVGFSVSTRR